MPRRRRLSKRRFNPQSEVEHWSDVFETGWDYFGNLAEVGVIHPVDVWPLEKRPAAQREFLAAAGEAWARLGHLFLADRSTKKPLNAVPWASNTFGDPKCR